MSNQLTVSQAAELHNVSDRQIRQWLRTGKLQGVKDSHGWMVLADSQGTIAGDGEPTTIVTHSVRRHATPQTALINPTLFAEVQADWGVSEQALQGEKGPRFTSAILIEVTRRAYGLTPVHTFSFPGRGEMPTIPR